jgi:hypothetical protein
MLRVGFALINVCLFSMPVVPLLRLGATSMTLQVFACIQPAAVRCVWWCLTSITLWVPGWLGVCTQPFLIDALVRLASFTACIQ